MNLKDLLFTRYLTLRNLFIAGNFVLLFLLGAAIVKDQNREWKKYQRDFYRMEKARLQSEIDQATTEEDRQVHVKQLALVKSQSVKLRQLMAPALDRYDRCITCHLGYDPVLSPTTQTSYTNHPFSATPHSVHKAHPVERFACTVCHEGQGLATTVADGHGRVKHWDKPLRTGAYIQSSCAKCHSNLYDEKSMPQTAA